MKTFGKLLEQNLTAHQQALETLAGDPEYAIVRKVARNPNTHPRTLDYLSHHQSTSVRMSVAENPNTPKETLVRLVHDEDSSHSSHTVLPTALRNSKLPVEEMQKILDSNNVYKMFHLGGNPALPAKMLHHMGQHEDHNIRWMAAKHPNASPETLTMLSNDPFPDVKRRVASNPNTPIKVLEKLSADPQLHVRERASEELVGRKLFQNTKLKESDDLHQDALRVLSKDENPDVRRRVARNRSTHPDTLHALSKDELNIRWDVALNPSTHPDTLHVLSKDENDYVRYNVAANPSTHPDTLHRLSKDYLTAVRITVVENPNTRPDTLHELSKDRNSNIRHAVAKNPSTRPDTLHALSKDEHRVAAFAALKNLKDRGLSESEEDPLKAARSELAQSRDASDLGPQISLARRAYWTQSKKTRNPVPVPSDHKDLDEPTLKTVLNHPNRMIHDLARRAEHQRSFKTERDALGYMAAHGFHSPAEFGKDDQSTLYSFAHAGKVMGAMGVLRDNTALVHVSL